MQFRRAASHGILWFPPSAGWYSCPPERPKLIGQVLGVAVTADACLSGQAASCGLSVCLSPASHHPRTALGSVRKLGNRRRPWSDSEPTTAGRSAPGHRHRSEPAGSSAPSKRYVLLNTGEVSCRSSDTQGSPSWASPRVSWATSHSLPSPDLDAASARDDGPPVLLLTAVYP